MALSMLVIMMMVFCLLLLMMQGCQGLYLQGILTLNRGQKHLAGQLIPGCGNYCSLGIMLLNLSGAELQLLRTGLLTAGENNRRRVLNLVNKEFPEGLELLGGLERIDHGHQGSHLTIHGLRHLHDRYHNVRQLGHTGGLHENPVRMIGLNNLSQIRCKVADQRTANAAAVNLRHGDSCLLEKTGVNADLTELILNNNDLLIL